MYGAGSDLMSYRNYAFNAAASALNKPSPSKVEEPPIVDKYKIKYKRVKKLVKALIFENAALCDQIAALQEKTLLLIEERNFLFRKLQQFQPYGKQARPGEGRAVPCGPGLDKKKEVDVSRMIPPPFEPPPARKSISKKRASESTSSSDTPKPVKIPKKPANVRKKKIVKSIPLDASGKPIFPIVLGDFTVHSLGEVCDKPEFHTDDLIFPVGYCSTRIYGSLKDPEKQCVYTCKVMDNGAQGPRLPFVESNVGVDPLLCSSLPLSPLPEEAPDSPFLLTFPPPLPPLVPLDL